MAKNKITMPTSGAGITRYFDEYKSKIELKPGLVVALILVFIIFEIFLHLYGGNLFG